MTDQEPRAALAAFDRRITAVDERQAVTAARVRELEHLVEIIGVALLATTPYEARAKLRKHLGELADVEAAKSHDVAARVLRELQGRVPLGNEAPPF